jgi:1-acyl-sn-glycerol-3-phosphate acyltransferase
MQPIQHSFKNYILTFFYILFFIIGVLIILPFVFFNDIFFDKYKGWNYNYRIFGNTFLIINKILGIKNRVINKSKIIDNQPYVYVSNHISYFDIPEVLINIKQPLRILAKKGPDKVPVFGYYYKKSTIMVDRSSEESRNKSVQLLRYYLSKNISILVYPEGTFNMTNEPLINFYDGAFKIAIETQTNIKPMILLDTYKILNHTKSLINNGISRTVFLDEVSVQGMQLSDVGKLKTQVYQMMENALIEYKASWIDPNFHNV